MVFQEPSKPISFLSPNWPESWKTPNEALFQTLLDILYLHSMFLLFVFTWTSYWLMDLFTLICYLCLPNAKSEPKLVFHISFSYHSQRQLLGLTVPAVQWHLGLFIHMFTYYRKYPTGHSAQRDYSGLNLSWHRNEQGSQWLRWLKLVSLDETHSSNKK